MRQGSITKGLQGALLFFLLTPLASLCFPVCHPAICAEAPLTITGSAPSGNPNAHEEALHRAFRSAIEQKVGIQVTADTRVKNAEILSDEIYTYSEGFVEKYELVGESVADDMLRLEVKIWVGANRLNKALFLNGLDVNQVYNWVGEPRVFIGIQEYIDGEASGHSLADTGLETLFREKGIRVVRPKGPASASQPEEAKAFDNPELAVKLGRMSEAEIAIFGRCLADHSRTLKVGTFELNFYSARLYLRAFNTATGEVLLSQSYSSDPKTDTSAMGRSDAAANAVANCIETSRADILYQIVRNWYDGFSKPAIHQVTIRNIDFAQLQKLKMQLRALAGVRKIHERSYADRVARLEIKYEGLQDQLADDILRAKLPCTISTKERNFLLLEHR